MAGGFRIRFSVCFGFELERLNSYFVFIFSMLSKIIHFRIFGVFFSSFSKAESEKVLTECKFRDLSTLVPSAAVKSTTLNFP